MHLLRFILSKKAEDQFNSDLTHLALMICSESKLDNGVKFISETLCNNGFPDNIVWSVIRDKISDFRKIKPDSVQRCPVYLRLPLVGDVSDRFASQISACVRKCYFSSNLWFSVHRLFWHLVKKTFSPTNIAVLWFILLGVFAIWI